MAAALVFTLLAGAFLVLNLGLLSKRKEDRVGGRTPSDLGILKQGIWPEEAPRTLQLPADDEEEQGLLPETNQRAEAGGEETLSHRIVSDPGRTPRRHQAQPEMSPPKFYDPPYDEGGELKQNIPDPKKPPRVA
jgi:hypothetical protein